MNFTPIRISTIVPLKKISFQLYIHYKSQYIKYKESGEVITDDLLLKLKQQNMARFFILESDELNYQNFLDEILQSTLNSSETPVDDKVHLVEGTAGSAVDQMKENPESRASYELTKKAANSLQKLILQNPEALKKFYGHAATQNEEVIKHCLNVSALSVSLASACKIEEEEMNNIGVAGLLHDIGISRLTGPDQELFYKDYKDLSPMERTRFDQHPTIGHTLLQKNPYVNPKILDLILHHEEKIGGNGYPDKLVKLEMPQEILNICNSYDHRVTALKLPSKQAIKNLQIDEVGNFSLEMIGHLKDHLKKEGLT